MINKNQTNCQQASFSNSEIPAKAQLNADIQSTADIADIRVDLRLSSYAFTLPDSLIAQEPSQKRGESRLYVLDRAKQTAAMDRIASFKDIASFLPRGALLIANNSMVIPARLQGTRSSGGRFEFLLLTPLPILLAQAEQCACPASEQAGSTQACASQMPANQVFTEPLTNGQISSGQASTAHCSAAKSNMLENTIVWNSAKAEGLLRPSKKLQVDEIYTLMGGLKIKVLEKRDFGNALVELFWQGDLQQCVEKAGLLPLPPYIKREATEEDKERYQTVYADNSKAGSVAAPTAGLHFTPEIKAELVEAGFDWAELTLFVGYGTFSPVRHEDIRKHEMHAEYVELSSQTVEKILQAKTEGRPVISVGTTSTRVLEGIAAMLAESGSTHLLKAYSGWLNCFIYPGKKLRVIDGMITNFHLPETTLLMLVSTLTGRERLLEAYQKAIAEKMHFFSYGDSMLII